MPNSLPILPLLLCLCAPLGAVPDERPTPAEVSQRLQAAFGKNAKKLAALAQEVEQAVAQRLTDATWTSGAGNGEPRPLAEHPHLALVRELASAARGRAAEKKNPAYARAMLEAFPWPERLELDRGLDGGTDRPVPRHEGGFILLGACEGPFPGYPEYSPNRYGYGTQELVGWHTGVGRGKKASYDGRSAKDRPVVEESLPPWAVIDTHLKGGLPDVPLFALPELTHRMHARLAERRRGAGQEPALLDRALAFFDGRLNGFVFDEPFAKDRMIVAVPFHDLFTDERGLFSRFPTSEHMIEVGDLPFAATHSYVEYGKTFLDIVASAGDFISNTPKGQEVYQAFRGAGTSARHYKALIDLVARALLTPEVAYPAYLAAYDHPGGRAPEGRGNEPAYDVARRHALVLWAWADKDPLRVADFLHDELLSRPELAFPSTESLPNAFVVHMRARERELLDAIVARSAQEGESRADFEREFSAAQTYLSAAVVPSGQALASSHAQFHRAWSAIVQDAAYTVVLEALGE